MEKIRKKLRKKLEKKLEKIPVAVVAGNPLVAVRIAVVSVESEQLRAPAAVEAAVAVVAAEPLIAVAGFAVEPWT